MSDPVRPDLDELEADVNYRGVRVLPRRFSVSDWHALIAYARALKQQLALANERADVIDARSAALIETTVRQQERERVARALDERAASSTVLARDPEHYSWRARHLSAAAGYRAAADLVRALRDSTEEAADADDR